ncbi:unnamed protein product [Hymenolepis diminuta]|uniref:Uncharacterized protein n=1 Tax=Hymenolepis diminuta TaxID=6216 RepID=A0A564YBY7_HYMDI|nr:unnamed protein product [Hymenolepis diminuta]
MLICSLRHTYSTHELPEASIINNCNQISSALFQDFCLSHNITHVLNQITRHSSLITH